MSSISDILSVELSSVLQFPFQLLDLSPEALFFSISRQFFDILDLRDGLGNVRR